MPDTNMPEPPAIHPNPEHLVRILARMVLGENRPALPLHLSTPEDAILWDMIAVVAQRCVDAAAPGNTPFVTFTNRKTKQQHTIIFCDGGTEAHRMTTEDHLQRALHDLAKLRNAAPEDPPYPLLAAVATAGLLVGAILHALITLGAT